MSKQKKISVIMPNRDDVLFALNDKFVTCVNVLKENDANLLEEFDLSKRYGRELVQAINEFREVKNDTRVGREIVRFFQEAYQEVLTKKMERDSLPASLDIVTYLPRPFVEMIEINQTAAKNIKAERKDRKRERKAEATRDPS